MERRGELKAKLFLVLLEQGGRWKPKDLAERARVEKRDVSMELSAMATTGYVRQWAVEGQHRRFVYGVTPGCRVPQGVTVQEVAQCVLAHAADTEEEVPA